MTLDVSIVVPSYNRRASLERLLAALNEQTHPADGFEVLVVDDGSTDGTPGFVRQLQTGYRLRLLEQAHQGPAQARNLGVAEALAPLVLFLDDDVLPAQNLIELHCATHAAVDPNTVVIGPMCPPLGWPRTPWVEWEEQKLQWQYDAMAAGEWGATPRQFYTANSSLSREMFKAAGGFDARFKRAEDVELGYRLRDAGASFLFVPSARVLHFASRTFSAWRRTPYQYGQYDVIMSRDKGHEALGLALRDYRRRHPLNRALAWLLTGRPALLNAAVMGLSVGVRATASLGVRRATSGALSGIFNLLYWQGVCDELGGRAALQRSLAGAARAG